MIGLSRYLPLICFSGVLLSAATPVAPTVFWANAPVEPNQTAMLAGGPFPADASVLMSRLADGPPGTPRDALTVVPMKVPGTPGRPPATLGIVYQSRSPVYFPTRDSPGPVRFHHRSQPGPVA